MLYAYSSSCLCPSQPSLCSSLILLAGDCTSTRRVYSSMYVGEQPPVHHSCSYYLLQLATVPYVYVLCYNTVVATITTVLCSKKWLIFVSIPPWIGEQISWTLIYFTQQNNDHGVNSSSRYHPPISPFRFRSIISFLAETLFVGLATGSSTGTIPVHTVHTDTEQNTAISYYGC